MKGIFEWIFTLQLFRAARHAGDEASGDALGQVLIYAGAGIVVLGLGLWNWIQAGKTEDGTPGRRIGASVGAAALILIGALILAAAAIMLFRQ